jgi:hypothetical protein
MKIVITEDQLDKLIQMSRKRHSKDVPETNEGILNYNGQNVHYKIIKRNNEYVYVKLKYNTNKLIYIMPDEQFLQLSKEKQDEIIGDRIKKFLDKTNINGYTTP